MFKVIKNRNDINFITIENYLFEIYDKRINIYELKTDEFVESMSIEDERDYINLIVICENWIIEKRCNK
ncbi:hypothetical protein [Clostridium sp. 1001271B_151109_B4]|uniref:hypothetical protein n=1 Tax=Clostridium sp. 1001271B_151109_B4 TaxID=2787148 RepID=UPI0018AB5E75|nr:hypothetical protein [Clostridium sp. 1001271B_151109_B4]